MSNPKAFSRRALSINASTAMNAPPGGSASADVAGALAIEIKSSGRRVEVFRLGSVAFALKEFHRHKHIEKIGDAAWMQAEFFPNLRASEPALTEFRGKIKRDCGEQDF